MDFSDLGINMAVVGGIIAITRIITTLDKENKLVRYYPVIPAVLAVAVAAFQTEPFSWQAFGTNFFIYVGAATYIYKFGKTTLLNK